MAQTPGPGGNPLCRSVCSTPERIYNMSAHISLDIQTHSTPTHPNLGSLLHYLHILWILFVFKTKILFIVGIASQPYKYKEEMISIPGYAACRGFPKEPVLNAS